MFTAVAHKNLAAAENYFDEHLAQNDYYAAGEIRPGQWIGAGAERLGLKNVVTREQFHALCENQNPNDGERLTQRQLKEGQRRVFYDFTCSAPKSVSVLAVTLADDRLVTAHEKAMRIAFRELETFAATRVRKQGNQKDRTTGSLVAAGFTHTSSRALGHADARKMGERLIELCFGCCAKLRFVADVMRAQHSVTFPRAQHQCTRRECSSPAQLPEHP
jgi:hypothetical protein